MAFNLFRLAGIVHGIKGRMVRGTAASAHAAEMAQRLEPLAELAWAAGGEGRRALDPVQPPLSPLSLSRPEASGGRMAETEGGGWKRLRRSVGQIGPVRLLATFLFLAAGLYVARFNADIPLSSDAERALYDWRFYRSAQRVLQQDDRIVLVTYNDETLQQLGKRSPLDRHMLAAALRAIDAMHPRAIGIDILIDQAQPEDAELIRTFRALHTPTYLAFGRASSNEAQIAYWQEQFMRRFLRQIAAGPVRPASIKMEPDPNDGVDPALADRARPGCRRCSPTRSRPVHPEFRSYTRSIDFRLPGTAESDEVPIFTNLPIQFVTQMGEALRPMFEGRYVLIGGDINDLDDFETPMTRFTGQDDEGARSPRPHARAAARRADAARDPGLDPVARGDRCSSPLGALTSALELRGWRLILALAVQLGARRLAALPAPGDAHRHDRPARGRLGRSAGCSPSSASARRRARSARSSAASPSRRSANICRPTSPARSCAIPSGSR